MNTISPIRHLALAVLLSLAAGCASAPPPDSFAELRYTHLPPITLSAGTVEVVQAYRPPAKAPNVEHRFPTPPGKAAEQWARDRLRAGGGPNKVRATVLQASVIEVPLARTGGLRGLFTSDQTERYDGTLEIQIELLAPDGRRMAMASSRATRSTTVSEDITLAEREKVWFRLTESMMNDLNDSLERQLNQHFSAWMVR